MTTPETNYYTLRFSGEDIADEDMSRIMTLLMNDFHPHKSFIYSWDDLGMANLMRDCYTDSICYCPQNQCWYIWQDGRWVKQGEDGLVHDQLETVLNLLLLYVKEQTFLTDDPDEKELLQSYDKYLHSIRKHVPMKNIIQVLATKVRKSLPDFDSNPYILNTTFLAYDLRDGSVVDNVQDYNVTMQTRTHLPDFLTKPCSRWYTFIDEIMSHDKEKAAFLQRALGYSLLGDNKEECIFMAYGAQSRNGKSTLFRALAAALGPDYMKTTAPDLICEKRNGDSVDFRTPQPMLAMLVGARIVDMPEARQGVRLDAAAMKTLTGRDHLTTRGLYEKPFSFVPQFTMWMNTNYLPEINDKTVFFSNRVWVIEFNEKFDGDNLDVNLKEFFTQPDNLPTILGWLVDGCRDYMLQGLNPPECVRQATENYRNNNDRIGRFIKECVTQTNDPKDVLQRATLYKCYREWCCTGENMFKPVGSTNFYQYLMASGWSISLLHGSNVYRGYKFNFENWTNHK